MTTDTRKAKLEGALWAAKLFWCYHQQQVAQSQGIDDNAFSIDEVNLENAQDIASWLERLVENDEDKSVPNWFARSVLEDDVVRGFKSSELN